jgi:hypothetical protein
MCDPVTIAAVVVGAASTGASIASQNAAASAQSSYNNKTAKANNERYARTVEETRRDIGLQTDQLYTNYGEQRKAMLMQVNNVTTDALKAAAVMETSYAASGVEGRTVDQAIREFEVDFGNFATSRLDELNSRYNQMLIEAQAIRSRGQNILISGVPQPLPPVMMPSPIPAILNGATTAIGVASSLQSLQGPPGSFGGGSGMSPAQYNAVSMVPGGQYQLSAGGYAQSLLPRG